MVHFDPFEDAITPAPPECHDVESFSNLITKGSTSPVEKPNIKDAGDRQEWQYHDEYDGWDGPVWCNENVKTEDQDAGEGEAISSDPEVVKHSIEMKSVHCDCGIPNDHTPHLQAVQHRLKHTSSCKGCGGMEEHHAKQQTRRPSFLRRNTDPLMKIIGRKEKDFEVAVTEMVEEGKAWVNKERGHGRKPTAEECKDCHSGLVLKRELSEASKIGYPLTREAYC